MIDGLKSLARSVRDEVKLPPAARGARALDRSGASVFADPGSDVAARAAAAWIAAAQDHSRSQDGGVARDFDVINGWNASYPETTGYIVPTLIEAGRRWNDPEITARARRMLDWLVAIQRPDGGIQGGVIGASPVVSVTFNTGQVLMGFSAGLAAFGESYGAPTRAAAQWLVDTQDADGCWRKAPTPFAEPGEKAYETHVSWGLFEAARVCPDHPQFAAAALRNVRWALGKQTANGWFADCCLSDPTQPLTHTLGYVLRGVVEAYRFAKHDDLLSAARKSADALMHVMRDDGFIPGRIDSSMRGTVPWVCLTGTVQIAACWFLLFNETGDERYLQSARTATAFVRRRIALDGPPETRGGVKGSFPIDGEYGQYQYLNWAAKFLIDACFMEQSIRK